MPSSYVRRIRAAFFGAFVMLALSPAAEAAAKRVLILHSFGRDFAPYDTIVSVFRTDLAHRSADPITFFEANFDFRRPVGNGIERSFLDYLRTRFDDAQPDVVVTIGPMAARFYLRHRSDLFPNAPMVMGALDARFVQRNELRKTDAVVAGQVDLPARVNNILRVLPETQTIAVVVGASELERFCSRSTNTS